MENDLLNLLERSHQEQCKNINKIANRHRREIEELTNEIVEQQQDLNCCKNCEAFKERIALEKKIMALEFEQVREAREVLRRKTDKPLPFDVFQRLENDLSRADNALTVQCNENAELERILNIYIKENAELKRQVSDCDAQRPVNPEMLAQMYLLIDKLEEVEAEKKLELKVLKTKVCAF